MIKPNIGKLTTFALPAKRGSPTIEEIKTYLENGIQSFEYDPADTDFQRGYQEALQVIYDDMFTV